MYGFIDSRPIVYCTLFFFKVLAEMELHCTYTFLLCSYSDMLGYKDNINFKPTVSPTYNQSLHQSMANIYLLTDPSNQLNQTMAPTPTSVCDWDTVIGWV